jgi:hypothetical protein
VQPRPETVQAVANLSYLVAVGHDMGLAPAYSKLIEHWVNGDWRFNDSKLNSHLYCAYRERPFLPAEDFAKLTASVLGITLKELPSGSPVNSAYPKLFNQLIDAFIQFNEDDRVRRQGTNPARAAIAVARDNLVANLEANLTGVAMMQIRELSGRLRQALAVFNHPEVIRQVAYGQYDHLSAIANLNGSGQPMLGSLLALHDTAIARNDIYDWIAPFNQKQFTAGQRFDRALRAAVTIRATAKWFTTKAGAEGTVTPFPSGKEALQVASR